MFWGRGKIIRMRGADGAGSTHAVEDDVGTIHDEALQSVEPQVGCATDVDVGDLCTYPADDVVVGVDVRIEPGC